MFKIKQQIFLALTIILLLLGTAFTIDKSDQMAGESWTIDKDHSAINFSVRHFFTPVNGRFEDYEADITFDPTNFENSKIDVTIPVESVNTENTDRDDHLKSEDFFNTSQWPNIHFESNTIEQTGENKYVARGEITIRDETRNFDLPFEHLGTMDHPMMEAVKVAGITANAVLDRGDFGVGVGDWAATMVVGSEVDIQLNLELNSK